jgi:hypothetical protein
MSPVTANNPASLPQPHAAAEAQPKNAACSNKHHGTHALHPLTIHTLCFVVFHFVGDFVTSI